LWIRSLGAVPIDRQRGALSGIRTTLELLKKQNAVLVFPEGSRTGDGMLDVMLPGFCLLARRSGATIVPVGIVGAYEALPRGAILARPNTIRLAFAPPITKQQAAELTNEQLITLVEQRIREAMGLPACKSSAGC
jgi:1-acyl-sn-glycerol-3-phosphate acyltransferase